MDEGENVFVSSAGVREQHQLRDPFAFRVAGLSQKTRRFFAVETAVGPGSILIAENAGRDDAGGGSTQALEDGLGDRLPVDRQGDGSADVRVFEHGVLGVEDEEVDGGLGTEQDLLSGVALQSIRAFPVLTRSLRSPDR